MARGLYIQKPSDVSKKIGELLIEAGLISDVELARALEHQKKHGGKTVDILIAQGSIDATTFIRFLSKCPGIPSIDLGNYEVPRELVSLVPKDLATRHEVFPIDKMGRVITLGMVCPLDRATIEQLQEVTGFKIRPILCSGDDIRSAIRRYYGKEEKLSASAMPAAASIERADTAIRIGNIGHLIKDITVLPPLPRTVEQLRRIIDDPNSSISDVARLLSTDPTASAKLLSLTNSAAFSFSREIRNVQEAVSLLGLRQTYETVLSAAALDLFSRAPFFDHDLYWKDTTECASCAVLIAETVHAKSIDGIFAAAVMHDIGRVALAWVAPERYAKVEQREGSGRMLADEREIFMIDHAEVGYMLASNWGLPEQICTSIRFHHSYELISEPQQSAALIALSCGLLDIIEMGRVVDDEFLGKHVEAIECLKLDEQILQDVFEIVKASNE